MSWWPKVISLAQHTLSSVYRGSRWFHPNGLPRTFAPSAAVAPPPLPLPLSPVYAIKKVAQVQAPDAQNQVSRDIIALELLKKGVVSSRTGIFRHPPPRPADIVVAGAEAQAFVEQLQSQWDWMKWVEQSLEDNRKASSDAQKRASDAERRASDAEVFALEADILAGPEVARIILESACSWPEKSAGKGGALNAPYASLQRVLQAAIADLEAGEHQQHVPPPDKRLDIKIVDAHFDRAALLVALRHLAPYVSDIEVRHVIAHRARTPDRLALGEVRKLLTTTQPGRLEGVDCTVQCLFSALRTRTPRPDISDAEAEYATWKASLAGSASTP